MEKGMKTDNEKKQVTPSYTNASGFDEVLFISLNWFDPCLKNNFFELVIFIVETNSQYHYALLFSSVDPRSFKRY